MPRGRTSPTAAPQQAGHGDMPNIHPVDRLDWVRCVIHAFPGHGKTSLIGSAAADGYKTLIIRSHVDLIPKRVLLASQQYPGMIDQVICDRWETMTEILEHARMSKEFKYDWVWWDNISTAQDVLLDDIWEATTAIRPDRLALTPKGGLDKGEYGRNMERIQQWVRHMVGVNRFHFGIMAHPFEGQHPTNDEGGTLLRPYVQGKQMTEKICGYANLVAFMELMENKDTQWRRLHTRESVRWYAKDQYDAFPRGYVDNPTVGKLMTAIAESKRPASAPRNRGTRAEAATSTGRGRGRAQKGAK